MHSAYVGSNVSVPNSFGTDFDGPREAAATQFFVEESGTVFPFTSCSLKYTNMCSVTAKPKPKQTKSDVLELRVQLGHVTIFIHSHSFHSNNETGPDTFTCH